MDSSGVMLVSLNCRLGEPFTPHLFWSEILTLLRDQVEGNAPLRDEIDRALSGETITVQNFQRVLRRIGRAGKYVVLLLDDFDGAIETHETYSEAQMRAFLDGVRRLAVHNPDGPLLSVTVTTFKLLNEAGVRLRPGQSPWWLVSYEFLSSCL